MTFVETSAPTEREIGPTIVTAMMAVRLAEQAFLAGEIEEAVGYVDMAYAIFDEHVARQSAELSASGRGSGRR